jgi:hypothetical protein
MNESPDDMPLVGDIQNVQLRRTTSEHRRLQDWHQTGAARYRTIFEPLLMAAWPTSRNPSEA